jgi:hypothetical protein
MDSISGEYTNRNLGAVEVFFVDGECCRALIISIWFYTSVAIKITIQIISIFIVKIKRPFDTFMLSSFSMYLE